MTGKAPYIPTQEEIKEMCEKIREESPRRMVGFGKPTPWEVPIVILKEMGERNETD